MKILLAMDNSSFSAAALEHVKNSYWPLDAEFEVVMVVESTIGKYPMSVTYVEAMFEAEKELRKEARQFVAQKVEELKQKFPMSKVNGVVFEDGPIADTILDKAKDWNADLIVLGSHGRTGLTKFLLGSVAERVASHARCSVEIIKTKTNKEQQAAGKSQPAQAVAK